jgi:hypothetical protein
VKFKKKSSLSYLTGHMILQALTPIPTAGLLKKDVDMLIVKVRTLMLNEFRSIKEECERLSKNPEWLNQQRPRLTIGPSNY